MKTTFWKGHSIALSTPCIFDVGTDSSRPFGIIETDEERTRYIGPYKGRFTLPISEDVIIVNKTEHAL